MLIDSDSFNLKICGAEILPFVLASSLGFRHAFETDHLVAVSNIVTKRNSVILAMKGGTF